MQIPLETPLRQPLNIVEPKTSVFTVLENILVRNRKPHL